MGETSFYPALNGGISLAIRAARDLPRRQLATLAIGLAVTPALAAPLTGATWLHFGANIGARDGKLMLQSPQEDLRRLGVAELERAGAPAAGLSPSTQMPFGESRAIHRAGGRYLTLIGSNDLFHLREDRFPDAVDVAAIGRMAEAAGRIALALTA